jgi:hypothetical protein
MTPQLQRAFSAFDSYNAQDENIEVHDGTKYPKEVLYGERMTVRLRVYAPDASEALQLAARCQHIGRWEIPRNSFPMDRKGYLQWRTRLSLHHAAIAGRILEKCGYDQGTTEKVKFLLQKKQLMQHHPETQILEDVVCLVFIEYYLAEFALQHDEEKIVDILKKTIKKMSPRALEEALKISLPEDILSLLGEALR